MSREFEWRWWQDHSNGRRCGYRAFDGTLGIVAVTKKDKKWEARRVEPAGSELTASGRSKEAAAEALLELEFRDRQNFEPGEKSRGK